MNYNDFVNIVKYKLEAIITWCVSIKKMWIKRCPSVIDNLLMKHKTNCDICALTFSM